LAPVQQQLAGAPVVGDDMGGRLDQRGDLRAHQVQFAVLDVGVAVGEVGAAGADRLDLPALQRQPGFEAFDQVVFEAGTLVEGDGPVRRRGLRVLCLIIGRFLAHSSIVAEIGRPQTPQVKCQASRAALWSPIPRPACSTWSTTWPPILGGSPGASRHRSWSRATSACWRGWTWAWARCGPGSPPRTPWSGRNASTCSCVTGRSSGCTACGPSTPWTRPRARSP